jgi:hypothetical protein
LKHVVYEEEKLVEEGSGGHFGGTERNPVHFQNVSKDIK